jgi:hypothetical protein
MSRWLKLGTLALLALVPGWAGVALARAGSKVIRYRGYRIVVPLSWPVYDLRSNPALCVRFNRHALYLGRPGTGERCPATAVGRTEAILVEPLTIRSARDGAAAGHALPPVSDPGAQPVGGSSGELAIPARGLVVTATWANHPAVIERALGVPSIGALRAGAASVASGPVRRARPSSAATLAGAIDVGLGFDACSAPSPFQMSAWASSPYRAVGVYIGGANMACAQPNLTAGWAIAESASGWHLIPTYVGLQAPGSACGCATIDPRRASAQGAAAAIDAVHQAQALGMGVGNPIYFDLEAYSRGPSNTPAALAFLSAWTSELHADGYTSGVYSSAGSGITDLVSAAGTSYNEPDEIWIAAWNGNQTTIDPYVPSGDWAGAQRLHQYEGGHDATYGGVTINIDSNYLDGPTAAAVAPFPDGTFVQVTGLAAIYRIAGGAPLYVSSWDAVGGPQPYTVISQQQFDALSPVPADGTFLSSSTGAMYRVAGGAPLYVSSWNLFGGMQPSVSIDQWDIDNITSPLVHLSARPADGTVVEGLPSHTYWSFKAGYRVAATANPMATQVDDIGLARYPQFVPPPTPTCVVPDLRRMTLRQANLALRRTHCRLGKVHQPRHPPRHRVLRVITQSPKARTTHAQNYAIAVTLR